jgi:hypothetical protein
VSHLNELEKAVLQQMLQHVPADLVPLLREQIDSASLVSRKNTGAGFYTELRIGRVSEPIEVRVIESVYANIEGFDCPMVFLLFARDGVIHQLEGAASVDSTVGVDFSAVRFTIKSGVD